MVPRQWSPSQVLAVSGAVVRRGVRAIKTSRWETCLSWGTHSCQPPSIASRYRISRYLRSLLPGARVSPSHEYPPRDGALCMFTYAACSGYMPLYGAGSTWKLLRLGHRHRSKPDPSL